MTITQVKALCVERLRSWSYFDDLPIFTDDEADLRGKLDAWNKDQAAAGGKIGAFVIISVPNARDLNTGAMAPVLTYTLAVQAHEDPVVNRDPVRGLNKMAEEICEEALLLLRTFFAGSFIVSPDPAACGAIRSPYAPFAFQAAMMVSKTDPTKYATVAMPGMSLVGDQCTLTCATEGAAIYYTLDGSYPRAGNASATLYSAPFTVAAGQTIRACAYLTDPVISYIPSSITEAVVA